MDEAARLEAIASDSAASRHPLGLRALLGLLVLPVLPLPLVHLVCLPGATPTQFIPNRDRYPHYGLIDFRRIDALGPTKLVAFDAELLAKCREWIVGSLTLVPLIADINAFFAGYDIFITNTDGYAAIIRLPGLTIAARINYLLALRVMSPGPLVPGSREASLYWNTVYLTTLVDVLCYRGLQDDMVFP